jgi:hypothetical protein
MEEYPALSGEQVPAHDSNRTGLARAGDIRLEIHEIIAD